MADESQPTIIFNTQYTYILVFSSSQGKLHHFLILKLSHATPSIKSAEGLLGILWSRLCPLCSMLVLKHLPVNLEERWIILKSSYPFLLSRSCIHQGIQELQGLLFVMSCSVEIRKGNLEFLADILGNTHSCSLVLFHRSCLAGAVRGSSLATHVNSARPFPACRTVVGDSLSSQDKAPPGENQVMNWHSKVGSQSVKTQLCHRLCFRQNSRNH